MMKREDGDQEERRLNPPLLSLPTAAAAAAAPVPDLLRVKLEDAAEEEEDFPPPSAPPTARAVAAGPALPLPALGAAKAQRGTQNSRRAKDERFIQMETKIHQKKEQREGKRGRDVEVIDVDLEESDEEGFNGEDGVQQSDNNSGIAQLPASTSPVGLAPFTSRVVPPRRLVPAAIPQLLPPQPGLSHAAVAPPPPMVLIAPPPTQQIVVPAPVTQIVYLPAPAPGPVRTPPSHHHHHAMKSRSTTAPAAPPKKVLQQQASVVAAPSHQKLKQKVQIPQAQANRDHRANQLNPNSAAHRAALNNKANQGNPNNAAFHAGRAASSSGGGGKQKKKK